MLVGVVTFHNAINYGAVLQMYALQQVLKEYGCKVETLNYDCKKISKSYNIIRFNSAKELLFSLLHARSEIEKKKRFNDFVNKYINLSATLERKDLEEYSKKYDFVITGSDQVWNYNLTDSDEFYFLNFVAPEKRCSYAASMAIDSIPAEKREFYRRNLKDFNNLSMREKSGADVVSNIVERPVTVDLDPVFLLRKKDWGGLVENKIKSTYILVYMPRENTARFVKKLSNMTGLNVVTIGSYKSVLNSSQNCGEYYPSYGPKEFVELIYGAAYVVTGSFHATAFSIIFNKEFFVEIPKNIGSRISDLLTMVGLENRTFCDEEPKLDKPINWDNINDIVDSKRLESLNNIKKYLEL